MDVGERIKNYLSSKLNAAIGQCKRVFPEPTELIDTLDLGLKSLVERPKENDLLGTIGLVVAVSQALTQTVALLSVEIKTRHAV